MIGHYILYYDLILNYKRKILYNLLYNIIDYNYKTTK